MNSHHVILRLAGSQQKLYSMQRRSVDMRSVSMSALQPIRLLRYGHQGRSTSEFPKRKHLIASLLMHLLRQFTFRTFPGSSFGAVGVGRAKIHLWFRFVSSCNRESLSSFHH